jgi:hypothetical protein
MVEANKIREHMEVLGSDGKHVGTVDHLEGEDRIKLAKNDPAAGGKHHLIPVEWVNHVDKHVHLDKSSEDVQEEWEEAA